MSNDRIVVNASPLITLAKSGYAELLPELFTEIFLPSQVAVEVGAAADEASRLIATASYIRKVEINIAPEVISWNLGEGESAVISFALETPGVRASIDDRAARRCAETLSIPTLGTIGILTLARRRGLIDSARAALSKVRESGLYVSDELIERLLLEVGE